ncbi:MAG TPA: hypothetical protein ENG03_07980 [Thioploca sp.]|nr:MAG: hypothetical protein B6247_29780 [Beggiatoa sp. 4572_84]RKZ57639.1 MAG: hypothetical protein DRR08_18440 [Gammaproteobacteria bacterium]HDN27016.1 hypothetical protein [Thioploca sp.]
MDNTVIYATVTYLLIFRLAIVILGGLSIVLGYRLFVKGIFQSDSGSGSEASELDAKIGDMSFTLKNAAPGTFFAAFGVIIVTATMMSSQPEANFHIQKDPETGVVSTGVNLRPIKIDEGTSECKQCENLAAKLEKIAVAMNELAWIYSEDENSLESALVFGDIAVELAPENASILDTRARVLFKLEKYKQAVEDMEKAVELLEKKQDKSQEDLKALKSYKQKLEEYRKKR